MATDILSNLEPGSGVAEETETDRTRTGVRSRRHLHARPQRRRITLRVRVPRLVRRRPDAARPALPKRGFHSPFRTEYQVVNLTTLEKLAADGEAPGRRRDARDPGEARAW